MSDEQNISVREPIKLPLITNEQLQQAKSSLPASTCSAAARQLCPHHPNVNYKIAWGCPDCLAQLRDQSLTRDEINFLLWCVGFAEGRARIEEPRDKYVRSHCDAARIKLMSMTAADD